MVVVSAPCLPPLQFFSRRSFGVSRRPCYVEGRVVTPEIGVNLYRQGSRKKYLIYKLFFFLLSKIKRFGEVTDDGCGCKQPDKIKLEGMSTIIASWTSMLSNADGADKTVDSKLSPESILKFFKIISDDDINFTTSLRQGTALMCPCVLPALRSHGAIYPLSIWVTIRR